ncbi:hypothetical protein EYR40_000995 [Pleurotus pulmonarius]|nr:hypothetical protein EYR36_000654 [Pleurotus pulmonarius]KAF4603824.1 hypothetical protein EYR38_004240 [Pleurotus pulmonarius]KAF4608649.1 hypothetical protein EYR40_000995 [Pleurotus pulmonarius]
MTTLASVTPAKELNKQHLETIFWHLFSRLARYRNLCQLHAMSEYQASLPQTTNEARKQEFDKEIDEWAQMMVDRAWTACKNPGDVCPKLDPLADTSTANLGHMPPSSQTASVFNAILFLVVTTTQSYSSRTRSFLISLGPLDEGAVVRTLKHPDQALKEAQDHAQETTVAHAERGKTLRMVGIGVGAVAGGILVGVTGGLAAPLVGSGVATILGWAGVGGTAVGLFASGLAGSAVVCGALFGAYGARSTAEMVQRYTREVQDLKIVPVTPSKDTLAVRLCVSGWLDDAADVTAPWTIFDGDDTFALQWEVDALKDLSNALTALIKSHAMKFVKVEIIKRTVFASLMASLSPIALLKIGQIIDNPWMNAKALAVKTGAVLGELIAKRAFGNRPLTLTGYSLGSLVIFEALRYLASLPPKETAHLIQDVYLFGTPVPTDDVAWTAARRLIAGRLVNGYASDDYVLAVLSRVSDVNWSVSGLQPVDVMGVENILCEEVEGHTYWRGMIGACLRKSGAPGVVSTAVDRQIQEVAVPTAKDNVLGDEEVERLHQQGV